MGRENRFPGSTILGLLLVTSNILQLTMCRRMAAITKYNETGGLFENLDTTDFVCSSPECYILGDTLDMNMDQSENKCNNYYKYAVGNLGQYNPYAPLENTEEYLAHRKESIIQELEVYDRDDEISSTNPDLRTARELRKICLDVAYIQQQGVDSVLTILNNLNKWPVIEQKWEKKISWQDLEKVYIRLTGNGTFHRIMVEADPTYTLDPKRHYMTIHTPEFDLTRAVLANPDSNRNTIQKYKTYIEEIISVFARAAGTNVPQDKIRADVKEMVDLEINLAKIINPKQDRPDWYKTFYRYSIDFLIQGWYDEGKPQGPYSAVNWASVIQSYFKDGSAKVNGSTISHIYDKMYLTNLATVMHKTSERTLINYIHWRFVRNILPYLDQQMIDYNVKLNALMPGKKNPPEDRAKFCEEHSRVLEAAMNNWIYENVPDNVQNEVKRIAESVKSELGEMVSRAAWLDSETKTRLKKALQDMSVELIRPHAIATGDGTIYRGMTFTDLFLENAILVNKLRIDKQFELHGKPFFSTM
ncbi:membrane metallo-endopeptidase-like 1 [Orussus abietinus]|uniref:membrane metallo-endopeptidase-like 1 n=1 Tax=Orussus abietinus TaxID=222816 RepID=UPI000C7160AB|nr:membrane metallo-endopeptidase-like 1 [Orussus abietinus]